MTTRARRQSLTCPSLSAAAHVTPPQMDCRMLLLRLSKSPRRIPGMILDRLKAAPSRYTIGQIESGTKSNLHFIFLHMSYQTDDFGAMLWWYSGFHMFHELALLRFMTPTTVSTFVKTACMSINDLFLMGTFKASVVGGSSLIGGRIHTWVFRRGSGRLSRGQTGRFHDIQRVFSLFLDSGFYVVSH